MYGKTILSRSDLESVQPIAHGRLLRLFSATQLAPVWRLGLWWNRLRNPQCPCATKHERAALRTSQGPILVFIFKEEVQILRWEDEIALKTNGMNGVERDPARWKTGANCSAVARYLPLVISNQAELEKSAEVFLQGQYLPKTPLHREGLTRRQVRAGLLAVAFPVGEQVCAGSLVLGDVERSAGCQVVAPISRADVIARSWNESACR